MTNKRYQLRYLPLFYDDLEEKVFHIAAELHNPQAANDLLDDEGDDKIMEVRSILHNKQKRSKWI